MQDRNVEFPNRFRMVKVEGTDDIYDAIPAPGEVLNPGTLLNKANLLTDETAALLGLEQEDPTVNEAFVQISIPQSGTGTLYVYCKDEAEEPVSGCVVQIGEELAVTKASGAVKYSLAPGTYSVAIRSPIDYGAEAQTKSVTVALGKAVSVEATIVDSLNGATEVDFTSSVAAAFSDRVVSADVFGVGGGGSGGVAFSRGSSSTVARALASGGAGGKTATVKDIPIDGPMIITVGAKGASVTCDFTSSENNGKAGGLTTVKTLLGSTILSVSGGEGGQKGRASGTASAKGASGGSGSGAVYANNMLIGASGVDGGNGGDAGSIKGGTGQGTTTRAFGEVDGELFSSAGQSVGQATSQNVKGTVGEGGGTATGVYLSSDNNLTSVGGDATTPGSGGGGAVGVIYDSGTWSYTVSVTSGAGASGLVRFRWEVVA